SRRLLSGRVALEGVEQRTMNNRHLLSWRFVKAAAVMFLLSGAGFAAYLYLTVNFSVVVPGELYRSAQPSPQELDYFKARYGIRSVLNLRGAKKNEKWYLDEIAAAKS